MGFDEAIMSDKQERLATVIFWLSLAAGLVLLYEYRLALDEPIAAFDDVSDYFERGQRLKWIGIVVLVVGPAIHYVLRGKLAPFLKDKEPPK